MTVMPLVGRWFEFWLTRALIHQVQQPSDITITRALTSRQRMNGIMFESMAYSHLRLREGTSSKSFLKAEARQSAEKKARGPAVGRFRVEVVRSLFQLRIGPFFS
jgi:hypothetical protein